MLVKVQYRIRGGINGTMSMNAGMMSSLDDGWETPQAFFDELNREFNFTLDAAASPANAKCERYYTKEQDALQLPWRGIVWCNPPYGRIIGRFVQHGYYEARLGATVVMLVPARTDTAWWHDWVMLASEIRLVRGRLRFVGAPSSAPFPSAVIVFRKKGLYSPRLTAMNVPR